MHPAHAPSPDAKVSLPKRIGWGFGGLADNYIMNTVGTLVAPVYNIGLGMDPVGLGIALFIPRFIDAIADPVMGNISDNTRSRWGRRRPYIVIGAILCAILLPLLWMPPLRSAAGMFWFFTIMSLIYSLAYTVFVVPYTALGYEMTTDYDERTRVLAWRMYIGLIGSMTLPWLYKLCLLPIFGGNAVVGAPWVCVGVGLLIVVSGILPAIVGRESAGAQVQNKIHLGSALASTMRNKPFLMLLVTYLLIICGIFTGLSLGLYVNIYLVCKGSKDFAATITGYSGTLQALTSYLSLPLIAAVSTRWGKRHAMITGLCFGAVGTASLWFTLTPEAPYLQLGSLFVAALGMQGCWLIVSSMVADICDEDELLTGLRREGIYSAVVSFVLKLGLAVSALTGGLVLKFSGYDAALAETAGHVADGVLFNMKFLYIGLQCATMVAAAAMFLFYPISRARSEETRRILDERARAKLS